MVSMKRSWMSQMKSAVWGAPSLDAISLPRGRVELADAIVGTALMLWWCRGEIKV